MKHFIKLAPKRLTHFIGIWIVLITFIMVVRYFTNVSSTFYQTINQIYSSDFQGNNKIMFYHRQGCSCARSFHTNQSRMLPKNTKSLSFCNQYSTLRGFHQRIISISMYGPKENALFQMNTSLNLLNHLIHDMNRIYPGWILRVYHDKSINEDIICSIECAFENVDFCNTSSLEGLGDVGSYIPQKIWRFIPIGDRFVDIVGSRDLDSPLSERELAAVNQWLKTNKTWHIMRDHPLHNVPILGGMWTFRSEFNRKFADKTLEKLLNASLIKKYPRKRDQTFLEEHVWPYIKNDMIVHDSYLCEKSYGKMSRPWPTRRNSVNDSACFVGCVRPCCLDGKYSIRDCPTKCRPKNHPDWTLC